jgi:uncharacterized membrane protein YhaH (DUF805 family)
MVQIIPIFLNGVTMDWYLKVLKNYATFDGRARRKEYWMFVLFNIIIAVILGVIDAVVLKKQILGTVYGVAVLLPGIAVSVRRMHDIGKSGWAVLVGLIPLIGGIILLIWAATDSTPGPNQYGPNPKGV